MKIYRVEFNEYTNGMGDTVSNGAKEIKDEKFLNVGNKYEFLCKESDLDFLKSYGGGFRKIELVGGLFEQPTTKNETVLCYKGKPINPFYNGKPINNSTTINVQLPTNDEFIKDVADKVIEEMNKRVKTLQRRQ